MRMTEVPIGSPIANDVQDGTAIVVDLLYPPKTLADVLSRLDVDPIPALRMVRTTSSLLVTYLNLAPAELQLDHIHSTRSGFRPFLEQRKYAPNSLRTYVNHVRILLSSAESMGWSPDDRVPAEWQLVLNLAARAGCIDIVRSLSRLRATPGQVTVDDTDTWGNARMQEGRSHSFISARKKRLWQLLTKCGETEVTPICLVRAKHYGVKLEGFSPGLKADVMALLKWKQAPFSLDRPKFARHRSVTAKNLRSVIGQLYGYAVSIRHRTDVNSLSQLFTKSMIREFVEWSINERGVKSRSIQCNLGLIGGALRQHPSYSTLDIEWLKPLLDGLPAEPESAIKKRKAAKYLDYTIVERIPKLIRAERLNISKLSDYQSATMAMNELLMKWIVTLPWRQRNLRECRIGGSTPNLFRAVIPPFSDVDKPNWVLAAEQADPAAQFWQFRFTDMETKTGREINALVPRQLIPLLEEYLRDFRPCLLRGSDPDTLFIGLKGKAFSISQISLRVAFLTARYGGRRVTPHAFRDLVSYAWLKEHAKDYLTLSKMLWHRNINTTISIYGSRFNESNGVTAMEAWLDERDAKSS